MYIYNRDRTQSRGGICFKVEIDEQTRTAAFSAAVCSKNDNFVKARARAIVEGRWDKGNVFEISGYDLNADFEQNLMDALVSYWEDLPVGDVPELHVGNANSDILIAIWKQLI